MDVDPRSTPRPQHAVHFSHRGGRVVNVFEHQGREDEIKSIIRGRESWAAFMKQTFTRSGGRFFPGLPGKLPEERIIKAKMSA